MVDYHNYTSSVYQLSCTQGLWYRWWIIFCTTVLRAISWICLLQELGTVVQMVALILYHIQISQFLNMACSVARGCGTDRWKFSVSMSLGQFLFCINLCRKNFWCYKWLFNTLGFCQIVKVFFVWNICGIAETFLKNFAFAQKILFWLPRDHCRSHLTQHNAHPVSHRYTGDS